jgi:RNA polymerase sigma factor (sigma-70 family)
VTHSELETPEGERDVIRAAARGDRDARDRLLVENLPLVRRIAARYRGVGLPYEDLVQEGSLGLLDAIAHYDASRGVCFDAYARFRVQRAIRNALTERARLVRLPKHIVERRRLIEREAARLLAAGDRAPTPAELAARTGLSVAAVLEARAAAIEPVSLDEPVAPDGSPLESLVADPAASDPERAALDHDEVDRIDHAVGALPRRQRLIVERTFGFDTPAEPIAAVAAELHLSPQRTRTIVIDALHKLRDELEDAATTVTLLVGL